MRGVYEVWCCRSMCQTPACVPAVVGVLLRGSGIYGWNSGEVSDRVLWKRTKQLDKLTYICRQIISEPDWLYSTITWILHSKKSIKNHGDLLTWKFFTVYRNAFNFVFPLAYRPSYSIHVIAEYNLSGSKIICRQIYRKVIFYWNKISWQKNKEQSSHW